MKKYKNRRIILAFLGSLIICGAVRSADSGAPVTEQHLVTDTYHGVEVAECPRNEHSN